VDHKVKSSSVPIRSLTQIREILTQLIPKNIIHPDFKISAILILLIPNDHSFEIILTQRSVKLHHHQGEISFPGGKFDQNEDSNLMDTALRETFEEIAISKEKIEIIGRLDDIATITGYLIRPFIGLYTFHEKIQFQPNLQEVNEILKIPIEFFLQSNLFQEFTMTRIGKKFNVLSIDYYDSIKHQNYNIWGATAHILAIFLKTIYNINVFSNEYIRPTLEEIADVIREKKKN
jgi:8-oxo-dGTP pyrophosphatase MutT (NUDIX family)